MDWSVHWMDSVVKIKCVLHCEWRTGGVSPAMLVRPHRVHEHLP